MEWFRFYHDAVDDPKVQRLSPALFKHWINLLCLASRNNERGTLPAIADIAFGLRLTEAKVRSIIAELKVAGLLESVDETLQMHNWHVRQKRSDDVKSRVDKYRASNDSVTLHETLQVPPDVTLPHVRVTETDTETDTEQNRSTPPTPSVEGIPPDQKQRRKTRLPDDWTPSDSQRTSLTTAGYTVSEIEFETVNFKNYHLHKGDTGLNWPLAFANWMHRSRTFAKPGSNGSAPPQRSNIHEFPTPEARREYLKQHGWIAEND